MRGYIYDILRRGEALQKKEEIDPDLRTWIGAVSRALVELERETDHATAIARRTSRGIFR